MTWRAFHDCFVKVKCVRPSFAVHAVQFLMTQAFTFEPKKKERHEREIWYWLCAQHSLVSTVMCKEMPSQGFAQDLFCICDPLSSCFSGQRVLLNVADSCYLYFYVLPPLSVSGALGRSLMLSLMSKCRVDRGKIQRDTIITAYVPREEDL